MADDNRPSLLNAPHFITHAPLRAMQAPRDMVVRVKAPDGSVIDELAAIKGEWIIREGNAVAFTLSDEVFRKRHSPLPSKDGRDWVENGTPVRIAVRNGKAWTESSADPVDAAELMARSVRCDALGRPLCGAGWPLHLQAQAILESTLPADDHVDALRMLKKEAENGFLSDPAVQCDLHLLDLALARLEDEMPDSMAALHAVLPAARRRALSKAALEIGIDPAAWTEVRHLPMFTDRAARRVARDLLAPHVEGFPLESVQVLALPHSADETGRERLLAWLGQSEELPGAAAAKHAAIPGYETSAMRRFRKDGMDYLVFEDLLAVYAYAWPSPRPVQDNDAPGLAP